MVTSYLLSLSQIIIAFPSLRLLKEIAISLPQWQASSLPGVPSPCHQPMPLMGQQRGRSLFSGMEKFPALPVLPGCSPCPPPNTPPLLPGIPWARDLHLRNRDICPAAYWPVPMMINPTLCCLKHSQESTLRGSPQPSWSAVSPPCMNMAGADIFLSC